MNSTFLPFLFDSEDTWRQAINDPDYRYDMPVSLFMLIYSRYRIETTTTNANIAFSATEIFKPLEYSTPVKETKKAKEDNSILNQSEIDSLLNNFQLTKENNFLY